MRPGSPERPLPERSLPARTGYRQRRLRDAAKLLPFFGLVLFALPLIWSGGDMGDQPAGSNAWAYLFGVWLALIGLTALCANLVRADPPPDSATHGEPSAPDDP